MEAGKLGGNQVPQTGALMSGWQLILEFIQVHPFYSRLRKDYDEPSIKCTRARQARSTALGLSNKTIARSPLKEKDEFTESSDGFHSPGPMSSIEWIKPKRFTLLKIARRVADPSAGRLDKIAVQVGRVEENMGFIPR